MRTLFAAGILAACWLSPASGACTTKNCTEVAKRPMEVREVCFAQEAALRAVVEEQSLEIIRLREDLEKAMKPVAATPKATPRKPCKRGRTRNSAGVCVRG